MRSETTDDNKPAQPAILALLALIAALLAGVIIQTWPTAAHADELANTGGESPAVASTEATAPAGEVALGGDGEESLDLDALEEPPAGPTGSPHGEGGISVLDGKVRIMGRFDATYELTNPDVENSDFRKGDFKSYHHHIFVKASPSQKVGLFAEVVDGLFAEFSYKPTSGVELKAGKIIVPFGDPGFHHFYAAVQGDPTSGILLPNIWAEFGATANWEIGHLGPVAIMSETYTVKGSFNPDPSKTLQLNRPATGNRFAVGERVTFGWDRVRVSGSVYWDEWNKGYDLFLYGVDATADYGLIKLPVLADLRLKAGLARAEVENPVAGHYYKYADYVELSYGAIREWVTPRLRYGSYIDDSRLYTNKDLHNWSAAAVVPIDVLTLTAEYLVQMEEVDEQHNDLFRLMLALDF